MKDVKKTGLFLVFFMLFLAACSNSEEKDEKDRAENSEETTKEEVATEEEEGTEEEAEDTASEEEEDQASEVEEASTEEPVDATRASVFEEEYYLYMDYLNAAVVYETEALTVFNDLVMQNVDDATAADSIRNEVIPAYDAYLTELENIPEINPELTEFNQHLLDVSYIQYDALVTLLEGLDAQDDALINEAYMLMEEHTALTMEVITHIADLSEKYGIPYDMDAAMQGL
ncbi:hypothetical protein [Salirhabdus sp. Marseille-P4669]|uniref:hypothetical protein n=1 Tax=Salirhabdus sp. Marseille-P4669 TaxID=2042310 RepID=UPI000C7D4A6A|nr:hypothetical protein [Salirhabdus sp. Marseille-P4669]